MRTYLICFFLAVLSAGPAAANAPVQPDEDAPAGVATNWILGYRLMREGDFASALPYLYLAYNAEPEEPLIALDFQRALAFEGYLTDAISVMDELVAAHPDSAAWRLRRATLNLRAKRTNEALSDLRELRRQGEVNLDVLGTEAAIHLAQGRVGTALDVYRDGLELLPEQKAEIYLGMARVLQETDDLAGIPSLMDEALAAVPGDPGLWMLRIRALALLDRHEEALAAATRADREVLPLRPVAREEEYLDDADYLPPPPPPRDTGGYVPSWPEESFRIGLAETYAHRGRLDLAVNVLEGLRTEGELGLEGSVWLARLLFASGRQEEAEVEAVRVTDTWPGEGRGWFLRGRLDESRGDWEQALERHRRAVELDHTDYELRIALVRTLLVVLEGDGTPVAPETIANLREELRRNTMIASGATPDGDAESRLVLGYACRALGDNQAAADHFADAAMERRLRQNALIQQSICLDELGRTSAARRVLETLHREFPDDAEVANSYGYFLAEKDTDLELAESLVRQALAVEPNNGAYLDSLGWVFYRRGAFEDAFDFLVRAVNVLPDDPVVLEHLGRTLEALGQPQEARAIYARALAAGGDRERLEAAIAALVPEEAEEP